MVSYFEIRRTDVFHLEQTYGSSQRGIRICIAERYLEKLRCIFFRMLENLPVIFSVSLFRTGQSHRIDIDGVERGSGIHLLPFIADLATASFQNAMYCATLPYRLRLS